MVVSRYYLGRRANILLLDLEIMKQIMVKEFNSFTEREVSHQRVCHIASLLGFKIVLEAMNMGQEIRGDKL